MRTHVTCLHGLSAARVLNGCYLTTSYFFKTRPSKIHHYLKTKLSMHPSPLTHTLDGEHEHMQENTTALAVFNHNPRLLDVSDAYLSAPCELRERGS